MKITTRQLKQIIAEEVKAAGATPREAHLQGLKDREADKRWAQLSASYPRAARGVGRAAFEARFSGGDPLATLLELVEEIL